jgi:hypothetical protein
MKHFTIDPAYITSVTKVVTYNFYANKKELTADELVEVLQGKGVSTITSSEDHPEFAKLRKQLSDEGFVAVECNWVNGDVVTKSFVLNNKLFKKDERFVCASAMHYSLQHQEDYNEQV